MAGIDMLLKELELLLPTAPERQLAMDASGELIEMNCKPDASTIAVIFKTTVDPFVGKLSFLKVLAGTLKSGIELVNATDGATEKIGKLIELCGKKQMEKTEAVSGDIVAVAKLRARTNDTLCSTAQVVKMEAPNYPLPCYRMAVQHAARGDEAKLRMQCKNSGRRYDTFLRTRSDHKGSDSEWIRRAASYSCGIKVAG